MIKTVIALCLPAIFVALPAAHAQAVDKLPIVFASGDWEFRKGTDAFTDETSCVILNKKSKGVQVTDAIFFLVAANGVRSYRTRLDEQKPSDERLATRVEERINSVILEGTEFEGIQKAERLRIRGAGRYANSAFDEDISLAGLDEALAQWPAQGCPASVEAAPPPPPPPKKKRASPPTSAPQNLPDAQDPLKF
jgi:hypothetical protein